MKRKEMILSTGKLPQRNLPRISVIRITGRLDMTSADYRGRKATHHANKHLFLTNNNIVDVAKRHTSCKHVRVMNTPLDPIFI